jgi:hypothetical protein
MLSPSSTALTDKRAQVKILVAQVGYPLVCEG